MADRKGLGVLGGIFGCITVLVLVVATAIVLGHLDGSLALDTTSTLTTSTMR